MDNTKLGSGWPFSMFQSGGNVIVPANITNRWIVAHELGHAFGLFHTGMIGAVMSTRGSESFLDYEMRWLSNHHFFNDTHIKTDIPVYRKGLWICQQKRSAAGRSDSRLYQSQLCRKRGTYILGHSIISGNSSLIQVDASRGRLQNGDDAWFQVMDVNGNYTFHHIPRIILPAVDTQKKTNKNPNITIQEPEPRDEKEIEPPVECPDCMPDAIDDPIDTPESSLHNGQTLSGYGSSVQRQSTDISA